MSPSLFSISLLGLLLSSAGLSWTIPRELGEARLLDRYADSITVSGEPFQTGYHNQTWLHRRQATCRPICPAGDEIDPDTPLCSTLCISGSDTCTVPTTKKRDFVVEKNANADVATSEAVAGKRSLLKRVINQLTQAQLPAYAAAQLFVNPDATFGAPVTKLVVDPDDHDDTTVTAYFDLAAGANNAPVPAFQLGSGPLVGCTVVIIVSRRGVYAGHFWEGGAWSCGVPTFNRRVLNWFNGQGTTEGSADSVALGTVVDRFNQPGDDTRVYIMHPRRGAQSTSPRYRTKLPQLLEAIKSGLGDPNVPIALYNYVTIDSNPRANDPNRPLLRTSQRGVALFQFDQNARGAGQVGWRIFLEHNQFQDTDPAPGPDSANGVPDN